MKRPQATDFYQRLGVAPTATPDVIKKTYRGLIRPIHPDVLPEDTTPAQRAEAEAKFKSYTEAYEVLSNPQKRREYDFYCQVLQQRPQARPTVSDLRAQQIDQEFAKLLAYASLLAYLQATSPQSTQQHRYYQSRQAQRLFFSGPLNWTDKRHPFYQIGRLLPAGLWGGFVVWGTTNSHGWAGAKMLFLSSHFSHGPGRISPLVCLMAGLAFSSCFCWFASTWAAISYPGSPFAKRPSSDELNERMWRLWKILAPPVAMASLFAGHYLL